MLKIEIVEENGSKIFYSDACQFKNYDIDSNEKVSRVPFLILFNKKAQVKSCQLVLTPGDLVYVSEEE